ncbi:MAG: ATP-dependent Lon protease [Bradymonadia bacterium]|jgi:ATP-dependent Lon protease
MADTPITDAPHSDALFSDALPVLPLRGGVILPGTVRTLPVGRRKSMALVRALGNPRERPEVIIAVQRDPKVNDPTFADLHPIATVAQVLDVRRGRNGVQMVALSGQRRVVLTALASTVPYWTAEVEPITEPSGDSAKARMMAESLAAGLGELVEGETPLAAALAAWHTDPSPSRLADRLASALDLTFSQRVHTLLTLDVVDRLERVTDLAGEILTTKEVRQKIDAAVRERLGQRQREAVLREQMAAIRKELGDDDAPDKLRARFEERTLPDDVRVVVDRELSRLSTAGQSPEANVIRNYLELIADLPWDERAEVTTDLDAVAEQLDADHFGLEDVKQRLLEHLAVLKLSGNPKGTILCLTGPPGTGKTSLAKSIAEATGRPFVRVALGGVRDESAVRGHRRTYIGAMPGRIIDGLRKVGAKNPVMLLDEIDKLTPGGYSGNPEAALLEVLDPAQNGTFTDQYLDMPFDLSEVLFICTSNQISNLSAPLRDRMEVVSIEGYTRAEKAQIARTHLLPRQLEAHGLTGEAAFADIEVTDAAIEGIVANYTREAGVRQLERELIRLCRAAALQVARGKGTSIRVDADDLKTHLGKPRYRNRVAERTCVPGVATGLAWTAVGGDILFIETSRMPGKGKLEITGKLGEVMTESARAALTYVRSHAEELGIAADALDNQDLHIHVPAGGTPKDGPSAGVTMFTALVSLLTGRRVRGEVAMTGECTLRGRVLPVGGIKSKILAAHRAGITHVVLPKANAHDLDELPDAVRAGMQFTLAEDMQEVLDVALEPIAQLTEAELEAAHLQAIGGPIAAPIA